MCGETLSGAVIEERRNGPWRDNDDDETGDETDHTVSYGADSGERVGMGPNSHLLRKKITELA